MERCPELVRVNRDDPVGTLAGGRARQVGQSAGLVVVTVIVCPPNPPIATQPSQLRGGAVHGPVVDDEEAIDPASQVVAHGEVDDVNLVADHGDRKQLHESSGRLSPGSKPRAQTERRKEREAHVRLSLRWSALTLATLGVGTAIGVALASAPLPNATIPFAIRFRGG